MMGSRRTVPQIRLRTNAPPQEAISTEARDASTL